MGESRLRELLELTRVRVLLFWREPEAVFWVVVFPLILAMVLGWAFTERGTAEELVGVDPSVPAAVVERLEQAEGLRVLRLESVEDARARLGRGAIAVWVVQGEAGPGLRLDPERPESELARLRIEEALGAGPGIPVETVASRGARYIDWLFPGLLGMNLMGTGIWGIGFAIADMRQKKLLRRFLVTPMRRSSFLGSFILSRGVFLFFELLILVGFALGVLGVPLTGSLAVFALTCLTGTLAFAGLGLLVASRAATIEGVSGLMNFIMLPMWLFSGVFFSYEKFPEAALPLIRLLPLTALNDALRGVMLEGQGMSGVAGELLVLVAWGVLTFLLALRIFRWA
ncbi:hypothetical protein ABI59_02555 [Acidobacteria bacterium Mor1]|nr:hypothetical protein ABI59_02555 [Acidobacteria bacterium Mor1]